MKKYSKGGENMYVNMTKYELWNALAMCPEEEKSNKIKELEEKLQASMDKPGRVWVDIREEV